LLGGNLCKQLNSFFDGRPYDARRHYATVGLCVNMMLSPICAAQAKADPQIARMNQIVQPYVDGNQFMGGGSRRTRCSRGYGCAKLEWDIPNAPNAGYRIGSLSKQFTAAAILLLEGRGKLAVTDSIKEHLPDAPTAWDKIATFPLPR
jgi:CubicO group peptidase (beta-lactamase class C family)